jgi:eukaryotic-like serine/threonine-protein kinase
MDQVGAEAEPANSASDASRANGGDGNPVPPGDEDGGTFQNANQEIPDAIVDDGDERASLWHTIREFQPSSLPRFADFDVIEVIGRGGMGVVYKAAQPKLNRIVALKVLPPEIALQPDRVQRIRQEATIAARASATRVVRIFDLIESEGSPILVMEFVDGSDLGRVLRDRIAFKRGLPSDNSHPLSTLADGEYLARILPMLDQVVEAVASVHREGIIHRDIKPSNLLLDGNGQVKITDFGLARHGDDSQITIAGQTFGTQGFMSPEQWSDSVALDGRTDVFALGATLYYALTLELPYGKGDLSKRASTALPREPNRRAAGLSRDLGAVILKALELDRRQRYDSAGDMYRDWTAGRRGENTIARPTGAVGRAGRVIVRHPWAAANLVLGLILIGAFSWMMYYFANVVPSGYRKIELEILPPDARVAIAPFDPKTRELLEKEVQFGTSAVGRPARFKAREGLCLVVVVWPDGEFKEVYRWIPRVGETNFASAVMHRTDRPGGVVVPTRIRRPPSNVLADMVLIPGHNSFSFTIPDVEHLNVPVNPGEEERTPARPVAPFYLDRTEVTIKQYLQIKAPVPRLPLHRIALGKNGAQIRRTDKELDPNWPIHGVSWLDAIQAAEVLGKRLPDEAEYVLAATLGGRSRYPWGDDATPLRGKPWEFGPVGVATHDRTPGNPSIVGLYSNVSEWVFPLPSSQLSLVSTLAPPPVGVAVSRGGPKSVMLGAPVASEVEVGPTERVLTPLPGGAKGVGFRCARSQYPRLFTKTVKAAPQTRAGAPSANGYD